MTNNINIRTVHLEDAKKLLEIYSYYVENTTITFEYAVPTILEFKNRIQEITKKFPYIVLEVDGILSGYAYANTFKDRSAYDWTVESSIYIYNNLKGKGYGKILHNELVNRLKRQGIVTIEACITYPNIDSIKFHEKEGYKKVAHFNKVGYKFNKWHDVLWYEKVINEHFVKENC